MVFGAGHGDLGRVALLIQQLLEGIQLVALVQGREISRLQHVTMGSGLTCLFLVQFNIDKDNTLGLLPVKRISSNLGCMSFFLTVSRTEILPFSVT